MFLYELQDFGYIAESHANHRVGGAVVQCEAVALHKGGAGEYHVGHVARQLIRRGRGYQVVAGAVKHLFGVLAVENGRAHGIAETVAGGNHAVVEHQPTLVGEERNTARADFGTLPGTLGERRHLHHAAVLAPVLHVGAVADVYVAERRVPVVARTAQHGVASAELLGKQYPVAVERQKGIFTLVEVLEVERVGNADGRSVAAVAPRNPVAVFNPRYTRVVLVLRFNHLRIARFELDRFVVDVPMQAVVAESGENVHLHCAVVAAEHAGEAFSERHHGTVENTVRRRYSVTSDDGILRVAP